MAGENIWHKRHLQWKESSSWRHSWDRARLPWVIYSTRHWNQNTWHLHLYFTYMHWFQSWSWKGTCLWTRVARHSWTTWSTTQPILVWREQCCCTSTSPSYQFRSASPTPPRCSRWHAEPRFMPRCSPDKSTTSCLVCCCQAFVQVSHKHYLHVHVCMTYNFRRKNKQGVREREREVVEGFIAKLVSVFLPQWRSVVSIQ